MRFEQNYPNKMEWWFYIGLLGIKYKWSRRVHVCFNGVNIDNVEGKIRYKVAKNWYSGKGGPSNVTARSAVDHCVVVACRV